MRFRLAACMFSAALLCSATSDVTVLLQSILNSETDAALPDRDQFYSQVTRESIDTLPASEVQGFLPLVQRCLASPRLQVRRYGLLTALAVSFRPDSSLLLEPIIDDIERTANDPGGALRGGALYVLANTNPRPSAKSTQYLIKHLENPNDSRQQIETIAVSLIRISAANPELRRMVFSKVERRTEANVEIGVLGELGAEHADDVDAQAFIRDSLSSGDPYIRGAAVETLTKLDANIRLNFADELRRIAEDSKELSETRNKARIALRIH